MILVLTGAVHSGKTSLLRKLIIELKEQGLRVDGYLSAAVLDEGEVIGYDLIDLKDGKASPFIRKEGRMGWQNIGPYFLIPEALEEAKRKIIGSASESFLVVDEVGPLEIKGEGIWPALRPALDNPSFRCLLVVRRNILEDFRKLLGAVPLKVFDIEIQAALSLLREEIQKAGRVKKGRLAPGAVSEE